MAVVADNDDLAVSPEPVREASVRRVRGNPAALSDWSRRMGGRGGADVRDLRPVHRRRLHDVLILAEAEEADRVAGALPRPRHEASSTRAR